MNNSSRIHIRISAISIFRKQINAIHGILRWMGYRRVPLIAYIRYIKITIVQYSCSYSTTVNGKSRTGKSQ